MTTDSMLRSYSIAEHQHRFAAWAAARAASIAKRRFAVRECAVWLEEAGFHAAFTLQRLPSPTKFDAQHRLWCSEMRDQAKKHSNFCLSHGQAAKILNCYLKSRFVNAATCFDPAVAAMHPPIDRLLIQEVLRMSALKQHKDKVLRSSLTVGWSSWDEEQYCSVISILRDLVGDQPFWKIEFYWEGSQPGPSRAPAGKPKDALKEVGESSR